MVAEVSSNLGAWFTPSAPGPFIDIRNGRIEQVSQNGETPGLCGIRRCVLVIPASALELGFELGVLPFFLPALRTLVAGSLAFELSAFWECR